MLAPLRLQAIECDRKGKGESFSPHRLNTFRKISSKQKALKFPSSFIRKSDPDATTKRNQVSHSSELHEKLFLSLSARIIAPIFHDAISKSKLI